MHLEGSLSPQLLFTLARRNQIELPAVAEDASFASPEALLDRYTHFTSLDDFLHYYFIGMSALIHAQDFEELAFEYFLRAKADGVVHAEVFFDPQAHTGRGVSYETVRQGFTKACQRAQEQLGISTELILCFLRHLPVQDAHHTLTEAKPDLLSGSLSGIGLDSSEKGNPPGVWRDIYAEAKTSGIKRTAHAGEEGPVEYIREAVNELDVERIDHGIRLAEDDELMREIAGRHLLVTVCPLSNVRLQCVESVQQLPIRKFLDAGVDFSINSDDPAYFGGYILDNYCAVQEAFELSKEDWRRIAKASVQGSWCDDRRKAAISVQLEEVLEKYLRN
ncbi:MAG: adenine deaminase [Heterodermia speciosa]|uniref:Adenine deaminase n=1 Tax=Heterodermia speciosa TaxID=116794 RepID=A0A8H3J1I1_9LECA|nr:MAG: adenine deaminase [Heterodermia speciosa]